MYILYYITNYCAIVTSNTIKIKSKTLSTQPKQTEKVHASFISLLLEYICMFCHCVLFTHELTYKRVMCK